MFFFVYRNFCLYFFPLEKVILAPSYLQMFIKLRGVLFKLRTETPTSKLNTKIINFKSNNKINVKNMTIGIKLKRYYKKCNKI